MLRHIVMFKFKKDAPADAAASIEQGLSQLAQSIPEIAAYDYGRDLALREGNYDFCLVAEFADAEAFGRYVVHSDPQRFIQQLLTPVVAERVCVQFEA
jgi:hypothetical protein